MGWVNLWVASLVQVHRTLVAVNLALAAADLYRTRKIRRSSSAKTTYHRAIVSPGGPSIAPLCICFLNIVTNTLMALPTYERSRTATAYNTRNSHIDRDTVLLAVKLNRLYDSLIDCRYVPLLCGVLVRRIHFFLNEGRGAERCRMVAKGSRRAIE